ncbi:hypothetical protein QQF64_030491 [Cirrhinus molitorella]|uniref:Uncharacterized protein n=1 Tax=Cirrhinus molitorella TaxID=172907 RepID=A0ABR3N3H9_9TELE
MSLTPHRSSPSLPLEGGKFGQPQVPHQNSLASRISMTCKRYNSGKRFRERNNSYEDDTYKCFWCRKENGFSVDSRKQCREEGAPHSH